MPQIPSKAFWGGFDDIHSKSWRERERERGRERRLLLLPY